MADEELVRLVLAGQTPAFAELIDRYAGAVLAVCRAHAGRREDAEDLAHEALTRALRDLGTLAEPARFAAWLTAIARHVCSDWLRDRENRQIPLSVLARDGGPPPEPVAPEESDEDDLERLRAAVDALPERCREAIRLYYGVEGATYASVAKALDVSKPTINARLTEARRLLRKRLRDDNSRGEDFRPHGRKP